MLRAKKYAKSKKQLPESERKPEKPAAGDETENSQQVTRFVSF